MKTFYPSHFPAQDTSPSDLSCPRYFSLRPFPALIHLLHFVKTLHMPLNLTFGRAGQTEHTIPNRFILWIGLPGNLCIPLFLVLGLGVPVGGSWGSFLTLLSQELPWGLSWASSSGSGVFPQELRSRPSFLPSPTLTLTARFFSKSQTWDQFTNRVPFSEWIPTFLGKTLGDMVLVVDLKISRLDCHAEKQHLVVLYLGQNFFQGSCSSS